MTRIDKYQWREQNLIGNKKNIVFVDVVEGNVLGECFRIYHLSQALAATGGDSGEVWSFCGASPFFGSTEE